MWRCEGDRDSVPPNPGNDPRCDSFCGMPLDLVAARAAAWFWSARSCCCIVVGSGPETKRGFEKFEVIVLVACCWFCCMLKISLLNNLADISCSLLLPGTKPAIEATLPADNRRKEHIQFFLRQRRGSLGSVTCEKNCNYENIVNHIIRRSILVRRNKSPNTTP